MFLIFIYVLNDIIVFELTIMPENIPNLSVNSIKRVEVNSSQSQSVGITFENILMYLKRAKNFNSFKLGKSLKILSLKNVRKCLHLTKSSKSKGYGKLVTDEEKKYGLVFIYSVYSNYLKIYFRWMEEYKSKSSTVGIYGSGAPYSYNLA